MKKISKKKSATQKPAAKKTIVTDKRNGGMMVLAIANILGFIAVIVINYLAVNLPLGGMTTGALSDLYPNLFTPAGITFSIRGLIYLALFAFVIRQIIDVVKKKSLGITKNMGIRFLLSCATNIGWIFAWHYQQVFLSVLIMIAFLVILIIIAKRIGIGKKIGTRKDKLCVHVPFSLYLGWISVAIIANMATWLVHIGWGMRGMTDVFRTILVIIVATIIALQQLKRHYNIIFACVVIWAFIGIIIKRINVDPGYAIDIIWVLGICIALITAAIGWRWEKWLKN